MCLKRWSIHTAIHGVTLKTADTFTESHDYSSLLSEQLEFQGEKDDQKNCRDKLFSRTIFAYTENLTSNKQEDSGQL